MQKMTALSNNLGGEAPKNDVFLQVKRFFWQKKIQMRLLTFLPKTSKFLQKFNFVREKVQKSFRNYTDEKAVPSSF